MTNAGDVYPEVGGSVMAALDAGSAGKTEQWIAGKPSQRGRTDCETRMDVEQAPLLTFSSRLGSRMLLPYNGLERSGLTPAAQPAR